MIKYRKLPIHPLTAIKVSFNIQVISILAVRKKAMENNKA